MEQMPHHREGIQNELDKAYDEGHLDNKVFDEAEAKIAEIKGVGVLHGEVVEIDKNKTKTDVEKKRIYLEKLDTIKKMEGAFWFPKNGLQELLDGIKSRSEEAYLFTDKEFMLKVIEMDLRAFEYASENLKDDEEFIFSLLEPISHGTWVHVGTAEEILFYLSDRLKNDEEFVSNLKKTYWEYQLKNDPWARGEKS